MLVAGRPPPYAEPPPASQPVSCYRGRSVVIAAGQRQSTGSQGSGLAQYSHVGCSVIDALD